LTSTHIQKKYSYGTENYSSKITRIKMWCTTYVHRCHLLDYSAVNRSATNQDLVSGSDL
jgi:hypothetical protein